MSRAPEYPGDPVPETILHLVASRLASSQSGAQRGAHFPALISLPGPGRPRVGWTAVGSGEEESKEVGEARTVAGLG